jgi:hypothetical protein
MLEAAGQIPGVAAASSSSAPQEQRSAFAPIGFPFGGFSGIRVAEVDEANNSNIFATSTSPTPPVGPAAAGEPGGQVAPVGPVALEAESAIGRSTAVTPTTKSATTEACAGSKAARRR